MNMPLDNTLSFPHGLIGLEEYNEFNLYHPESDKPTVFQLQSTTDDEVTLSVISPDSLDLEYKINLSDEEQELLELSSTEDAVVALIVYKPTGKDESPLRAMVQTPIIINTKSKLAMQKSLGVLDIVK